MTKEVSLYPEKKTASSINGVGKTGQLYVKEPNWFTFSDHMQK